LSQRNFADIKRLFSQLIGMKLDMLHFAGDMSMWKFSSESAKAYLHVQCSYRFTCDNQTILCQRDFNTIVSQEKFNTLLHAERDLLAMYVFPIHIDNVSVYDNFDVRIDFQNNISLYIYADLPAMDEQWRFWKDDYSAKKNLSYIAIDGTMKTVKNE